MLGQLIVGCIPTDDNQNPIGSDNEDAPNCLREGEGPFRGGELRLAFIVNDNAREFAVLRALGLRSRQVVKVYVVEALVLVTSSFLLGSLIGILVAVSLTLQFNLFIESPFIFNFPTTLFFILAILGLVVASAAAYFPSNALVARQISHVLKSG